MDDGIASEKILQADFGAQVNGQMLDGNGAVFSMRKAEAEKPAGLSVHGDRQRHVELPVIGIKAIVQKAFQ